MFLLQNKPIMTQKYTPRYVPPKIQADVQTKCVQKCSQRHEPHQQKLKTAPPATGDGSAKWCRARQRVLCRKERSPDTPHGQTPSKQCSGRAADTGGHTGRLRGWGSSCRQTQTARGEWPPGTAGRGTRGDCQWEWGSLWGRWNVLEQGRWGFHNVVNVLNTT